MVRPISPAVCPGPEPTQQLARRQPRGRDPGQAGMYRHGGEVSERQWQDIQVVLDVQEGHLDQDYLQQWADSLGVADLLAKALTELNMRRQANKQSADK